MTPAASARGIVRWSAAVVLALACVPLTARAQSSAPFWGGHGRNAQHTALADVATQPLARIRWQTRVDAKPQYRGDALPIHYGSPLVTQGNTVVIPVKTRHAGGFRLIAFNGSDGTRLWRRSSNYTLPPHDWVLPFSPALAPDGTLWMPGHAGTLYACSDVDTPGRGSWRQVAFYGFENYRRDRRAYRTAVYINTPLTAGGDGSIFFGFQVTAETPAGLRSGIARIGADGAGTWVPAATAAGDPTITKVAHNSAPALSTDGAVLYVAVSDGDGTGFATGYLVALDSHTLAPVAARRLVDPASGLDAILHDDGTASPTVGPDGDVYFGVVEAPFGSNHGRGWLLHFDAGLQPTGVPGAFGWDDTASIVPAAIVPSYPGSSSYLVLTKYNDYAPLGGDGVNRLAVLDPNTPAIDPISGTPVMAEVLTVAGPTPDPDYVAWWPGAVKEWCINTAAVDPIGGSVLAGNEDGRLYRWSMASGLLSESIVLTPGIGQAYTPTVIGPDGSVYAINNATLFAVGS